MMTQSLSRQLAVNESRGRIRLYYQADLIVNRQTFDQFVDRLVQEGWELDIEAAIKRALSEMADSITVNHSDLLGIESPKVFFTEPMPTGEEYSL